MRGNSILYIFGFFVLLAILVPGPEERGENEAAETDSETPEEQAPAEVVSAVEPTQSESDSFERQSEMCGQIIGQTAEDLRNLQEFCSDYISKGAVSGSYAAESLLWIKVPREIAEVMQADRLGTEQLVRSWMQGWKNKTDRNAVTVTVEWRDVEIAVGETSWSGRDEVTIR